MRLYIHGPYPPPIGGISIHIKRMVAYLEQQGVDYKILDHGFNQSNTITPLEKSYLWYLMHILRREDNNVYHYHQFMFLHYLFYFLKSKFSKSRIIITIHSNRILNYGKIKKRIALLLLRNTRYSSLLSVSKDLSEYLNLQLISCTYLPAYVPPIDVNPTIIPKKERIRYFMFSMWKVNKDLSENTYDLPLVLEFLNQIKKEYKLLFLVGSKIQSDMDYLDKLISSKRLNSHVKILFNKEIVKYISNCDFLLRCNIHDGYGVSLQESLDMGVPAIATSVCERPKGTILFKSGEIEELIKVFNSFKKGDFESTFSQREKPNYHIELLKIYKSLVNEASHTKL